MALLLCAVGLPAQQLRGTVLLPDSTTPASSVIITASDANGALVGRGVSDAQGAFRVQLSRPGRVTVRALRVGYRPTVLPPTDAAAGDTITFRIALGQEPVRLAAITVRGSDRCRARDDARAGVADVWEEARKALLLANAARPAGGIVAEWVQYDRHLDSLGARVLDQASHITRATSERPFRSWHADSLAAHGYVVEDAAGVSYYAPDADVLLSESFAATHCFLLAADPADATRIGVRFRPVDEARRRRDIEGTLWLDRATAELRHLEFAYTGLPLAAARAEAGGRVDFLRIPDGAWLVRRWWIRMPDIERVVPSRVTGGRIRVVGPSLVLRGVKVVGGEVTQVERAGTEVFRAVGASLAVHVTAAQGEDARSAAGARVSLTGSDYAAVADADGVARFPLVLAGRYRVAVTSATPDADRGAPVRTEVEVRGDSAHVLTVRLPARRVAAATVEPAALRRHDAEVEFTVTDSTGHPVAEVEIVAVDAARVEHRLRSDSLGRARLAGLPPGDMRVEARRPGYYLAFGTVVVAAGVTPATVLLEPMVGGVVLETVRVEAEADERARYGAFEARRRAGTTTATITREQLERRNVVNAWQMLLNVSAVHLIEGPEGVLPVSRRMATMDLRAGTDRPCYMRMAIDGVLLPDNPVNLRDRMPPVPEIHGIEVFAGPATVPSEYIGDQRDMGCGLIAVWTR